MPNNCLLFRPYIQSQMAADNHYHRVPKFIDIDSSDSEDQREQDTEDRFILPSEGHDKRLVLMSVLVPYSHTYMAVAHSLPQLLHCMLPESNFVRVCIEEITRCFENAECKYGKCGRSLRRNAQPKCTKYANAKYSANVLSLFPIPTGESISTDTIRNCMKVLEKQSYIEVTNIDGVRHVALGSNYESADRVDEIIARIESVMTF